jgi:YfiH family protein
MWTRNAEGVFESDLMKQFPWLWHGFGTRTSGDWPGLYTHLKQIHSDIVYYADKAGCLGEGDALVTDTPGVRVGIRTADCVPILLVDPEKRAVGAVHAGWRGTVARLVQRTIEQMTQSFGSIPEHVHAAIGPCIARCCFEVGPEVAKEFQPWLTYTGLRTHVDLVEVNLKQLEEAGVPQAQIDTSALCTVCDADQFHSFRRDREASGRMVAAIGIVGG